MSEYNFELREKVLKNLFTEEELYDPSRWQERDQRPSDQFLDKQGNILFILSFYGNCSISFKPWQKDARKVSEAEAKEILIQYRRFENFL